MRMRVFIALLCCLMLSGCQHGVSLPAADNAEAAETAVPVEMAVLVVQAELAETVVPSTEAARARTLPDVWVCTSRVSIRAPIN